MPVKELQGDWKAISNPSTNAPIQWMKNPHAGLEVTHDGTQVLGVIVYFHSDEFEPFSGVIEGGIGQTSSIEDVIHVKGQPETISVMRTEKGEESVDLSYLDQGISFEFVDKKLATVRVGRPLLNVPTTLKKDIGATEIYRAIRPK